jgi:uncharacterized protein YneF (UPF0154 family)
MTVEIYDWLWLIVCFLAGVGIGNILFILYRIIKKGS